MATTKDVGAALEKAPQARPATNTLKALLSSTEVQKRFQEVLGAKAPGFISSILSATNANKDLRLCDPMSIISSAAIAASLDLPINSSLGFAAIVPYKGKAGNQGSFQIMWKGFVQLGMRSGQYRTMNVTEVYDGELISSNRFTGEMVFDESKRKTPAKIIGYVSFFRLVNGFEKYLYMTREEVERHGKRYSKSYDNEYAPWKKDFDAMAKKTVIKMLLSKFGILSIEMQKAVESDQAVIREDGTPEYIDNMEEAEVTEVASPVLPEKAASPTPTTPPVHPVKPAQNKLETPIPATKEADGQSPEPEEKVDPGASVEESEDNEPESAENAIDPEDSANYTYHLLSELKELSTGSEIQSVLTRASQARDKNQITTEQYVKVSDAVTAKTRLLKTKPRR